VAVSPTANYPLDLYFLMDLSNSMRPLVNQLYNLSQTISEHDPIGHRHGFLGEGAGVGFRGCREGRWL